ncbi:MAG: 5'/3'-nucleotidase SurE [Deltaproteobacteria bacterium]|nr:5'/3'-nucleotidase SurE [Deltaproteobacteria bacterium]MBW2361092.1 5'/3'-nucleotidase SurE [Deltaproteobacteria bacterium]
MLRLLLAALLLGCSSCAHADGFAQRLDILLTNDDGYEAAGLRTLRAALEAEGHAVSVVAPAEDRSGSSVSITTRGTLSWREVEPGVVAVDGTPADCVRLAFTTLRDGPPDLVVSGINFGQNVGSRMLSSGTVGAALTSASLGVPAIAVSQAVDPNDIRGTERYFPAAAAFAVRLVRALRAEQPGPLLSRGMALNVNHPPRLAADVQGVKLTRQGRSTLYSLLYTRRGEAAVSMAFVPNSEEETVPDADTAALAEGYVSVTPLEGSWTADAAFEHLRGLAKTLDALASGGAAAAAR